MKKHFLIPFAFCLLTSFLFSQGTWTQKADFGGGARQWAVGFAIGSKGFIGTGSDGNTGLYNDFWEWNPATNGWTQKASIWNTTVRFGCIGFSINGKGYIGTGKGAAVVSFYKDFWEWDPATDIWTQKASFAGTARLLSVGFSIGGKGYLGTGSDSTTSGVILRNDFWEWDPVTNAWTQKADFGGAVRAGAVGFSIGTKGYIGTGSYKNDFWEWDQATNVWIQKANFGGTPRTSAVGFSIGTKGYIGTGHDTSGNYRNDFWAWDQLTDSWTQEASVGGWARGLAVGFSVGNKGYIGTGHTDSPVFPTKSDFWEFDPNGNGMDEIENQISISFFPNPFTIKTTFTFSELVNDGSLKIYSISGQEVRSFSFSGRQFVFERRGLPSGVYFYQVISNGRNIAAGKLIIE